MGWRSLIQKLKTMGSSTSLPRSDNRKVIIHNHLFKNAGTTIDWALAKNFQEKFIDHRDDEKMMRGADYLGPYLTENPEIAALSSHHLRLPLPTIDDVGFYTIMMFRHPLERVRSVYRFERRQTESDTLGARFARDHSLCEYVEWRMKHDVPPSIRNFHVFKSQSPSVDWRREMDEKNLSRSKAYIDGTALFGFVEFFDESMILFEKTLREYFPFMDLSYVKQNIGQTNTEPLEIRIEKMKNDVGNKIFALLSERNRLDLKLYDYARKKFLHRLRVFDDLEKELKEFRNRCVRLSAG